MTNWRILYLEDDIEMHKLVSRCLPENTRLYSVATVDEALRCLQEMDFHIILIDLALRQETGFDFLESLKDQEFNFLPTLIVITGSGEEVDEIKCHDFNVHEFVRKPLRPQVFSSLIQKFLRRFEDSNNHFRFGPLEINKKRMEVKLEDKFLPLTIKEYQLLKKFVENPGKTISREELFTDVWEGSSDTQTRTIDMHVSALRKKLGNFGESISSIRGVGYVFSDKLSQT